MFSEDFFEAYNKLRRVAWTEESVDVYTVEIRRLAGLVGYMRWGLKKTGKMNFMSGFPDRISIELQWLTGNEIMEVEELLKHARVLAKHPNELGAVATSAGDIPGEKGKLLKRQSWRSVVRCFICQVPYLMRDCKEPRPDIICFWCD